MNIMEKIYQRAKAVPQKVAFPEATEEKILLAARECADKSVTLVKDTQGLLPITSDKYKRIRLYILGEDNEGGFKEGDSATSKVKEKLEKQGLEVIVLDNKK